ncbi:MAG: histidine triad nucleotide-binding protein [Nitrospinota bacterium]|nr:histidine triad nucleotide-binding protein [Nitrospinota bacterium]
MSDCVFCKIAKGIIPSQKVAETDTLYAFQDINPVASTHILIIPKRHIENNLSLTPEDNQTIGEIFLLANELAVKQGIDKSGFRVVVNNGSDAGQAVFHIHFHLLGGRIMLWPPG